MDSYKSYEDFVSDAKKHYQYHISEANKFRNILEAAGAFNDDRIIETPSIVKQSKINDKDYKVTFEDFIVRFIKARNRPVYSTEIQEAYKKEFGITIEKKDLSSKMSIVAKKKGVIKYEELKQVPANLKYWWGLTEWFDGNIFKYEYKNKIMEYIKEAALAA